MVIRDLAQQGPCNEGGGYVTAHRHAPASGGHTLFVSGPEGAVTQVRLTDPTYTLRSSTTNSHSLHGAGPHPTPETSTLLKLLMGVVTLPCGGPLDFAIALDWFNKVVDGAIADLTDLADLVHRAKYLYTPLGDDLTDLVHRGKYSHTPVDGIDSDGVDSLEEVGWAVVDEIAEFVAQHPLLNAVDAIAAPPGHDPTVVSFGSRVAAGVAMRRDVPIVRCSSPQEFRVPVRSIEFSSRATVLSGQFSCPGDVSGQRILIVDDVWATGATAQETARALRAAGATHVASVAAIRTMEFRDGDWTF